MPGLSELELQLRPKWLFDFPLRLHGPNADFRRNAGELVAAGVSRSQVVVSLNAPVPKGIAEFRMVSATAFFCSAEFEPVENFDPLLLETLVFSHDDGFVEDVSFRNFEDVRVEGKVGWFAVSMRLIPMPVGHWHDEYLGAGTAVPAAYCFDLKPQLSADERGLALSVGEDVVATTSFWHDSWTPLAPREGATRVGVASRMKRRLLKKALQRFDARLGWFVRLRS